MANVIEIGASVTGTVIGVGFAVVLRTTLWAVDRAGRWLR